MKPIYFAILACALFVTATFSIAVLEGARMAEERAELSGQQVATR